MITWYLVPRECEILLLRWLRYFPISLSLFQIFHIFSSKEENKIYICDIFHLTSLHVCKDILLLIEYFYLYEIISAQLNFIQKLRHFNCSILLEKM